MTNATTVQRALPVEIFEQHAGEWIALRGDEIVAAAASLEELRANPDVTREDAVFAVPERPTHFL